VLEGIEAIVFRTIGDRPPPWESRLPPELLRLPEELARVDALLDDPAFFAPFAPHFHPVLGRPSTPAEWYLRLMFLKFRYRLVAPPRRPSPLDENGCSSDMRVNLMSLPGTGPGPPEGLPGQRRPL
jgi:hypothetical protein